MHTTPWIEYTANMKFDRNGENLSFAVTDGRKILAIVPFMKEKHGERFWLSYAGLNTPYPAFANGLGGAERKALDKFIFEHIRSLTGYDYANFYVPCLTDEILNRTLTVNPLPKHGFQETSISSNILSLNEDAELLFRNFRKGCKSDIKTAQKRGYTVSIMDKDNYEASHFDTYRKVHFEAAGRQTRPDETWEWQRRWIQNGFSLLAVEQKDGEIVSAGVVNTYKQRAYYQSCATKVAFEREVGIGHLMQWEIIRHLKQRQFTHYEIGWNFSPNISQEVADPKLLGISRFKTGFGADIYPLFRGERFQSVDYMKSTWLERLAIYEPLGAEALEFKSASDLKGRSSPA